MKTPVKFSIIALTINTIFSLILMNLLGVYGLALANLISALSFSFLLTNAVNKQYSISIFKGLSKIVKPICGGMLLIASICFIGDVVLSQFEFSTKVSALLSVTFLIPLSACAYFIVLSLLGVEDLSLLKRPFIKKPIKP
jgi:peptidoglycan biosynthesis protein MviN/MurJ (putative lipid II flippase)